MQKSITGATIILFTHWIIHDAMHALNLQHAKYICETASFPYIPLALVSFITTGLHSCKSL